MSGRPTQYPRKLAFEDLPKFIREWIEFPDGQEQSTCWTWTGRIQAARQKRNLYRGGEHPELRENLNRSGRERPTPRTAHHFTGRDIDAHRLVYSFATCTAVEDLPRLRRCRNDACVSPYCTEITRPLTAAERKRGRSEPEPVAETVEYTHDRCMALLKAADDGEGVSPEIDRSAAAEEAGIPPDKLTEATWLAYCLWDAENNHDD